MLRQIVAVGIQAQAALAQPACQQGALLRRDHADRQVGFAAQ